MTTLEALAEARAEVERPLASYSTLIAAFSTIVGGGIALAGATGRLPQRPSLVDLALVGVAGHKVSRLIAKDKVASPVRAPFVRTVVDEEGDLVDEAAGTGCNARSGSC